MYLIILAVIVLILHNSAETATGATAAPHTFYGVTFVLPSVLNVVVSVLLLVILALPLIHMLGFLPQIPTLASQVLEQWILLGLGGTATVSLVGATAETVRSFVFLLPPYFALVGALAQASSTGASLAATPLFALACGLLLAAAYFSAALEPWQTVHIGALPYVRRIPETCVLFPRHTLTFACCMRAHAPGRVCGGWVRRVGLGGAPCWPTRRPPR